MHRILALAAALAFASVPLAGLEPPAGEELARRLDSYAAPFLADGHLSGHLLVARGGEIVYERSFGMANWELETPVTADTRFNIASITKPITGLAGLQLIAAGKLSTADTLSRWIPDFPRGDEITIGQLFTHQAGIPHRVTTDAQESQPMTAAEVVELAKGVPLLFDPGTSSTYSSAGYSVLARVLELASGESYGQLVENLVFVPAGMTHSVHPVGDLLVPRRASSYLIGADGRLRNAALKHYSFLVGAGSIYSTARDLLALQRALLAGRYGDDAARNFLRDGDLSWNGRTDGFRAFADYDGDTEVSVIFTGNLLTGAADRLRADVPRIVAGEEVSAPARLAIVPATVAPEVLARYEGTYQLRPGTELELSVEDGVARLSGWTLIPTSETSFFSPQDYGRVEVVLADDGAVERLDWEAGGQVYPMPRVGPLSGAAGER